MRANSLRHSDEVYNELAQGVGLIWLGPLPQNVQSKTSWQCEHGHVFLKSYASLSHAAHSCPVCFRAAKVKSARDYDDLAQSRNFTFVGPVPGTVNDKAVWECRYGHRWEARYSAIQRGSGCPTCYHESRKKY